MDPILYADVRCLQDHEYRVRGIGHHVMALLRTRAKSAFANWKVIGLIDPKWSPLPARCASLVNETSASLNPYCNGAPAIFVDGTPMTHDSRFSLRFVGNPAILSAAAVHDFIPLDWPGYLPKVQHRIDYLAKMARLSKFDYFLPVSDYTAWRLSDLLGIPEERIRVTGSSVRDSLYKLRDRAEPQSAADNDKQPYFFMVVGPDRRKNPEVVVKAVRRLNGDHPERIYLKVAGHFNQEYRDALLRVAGHSEGEGFLEFCVNVPDEQLVQLFSGAVACVVPSHIEGFSLPVVEASISGCPVIASTCAAHLELIEQREALFPSSDETALSEKLRALLNNQSLRASLIDSQAHLGAKFHEEAVGGRFWSAIETAIYDRSRSVRTSSATNRKPRIAFLSPYPPDPSEAAFYTAMTMQEGGDSFEPDLYSETRAPLEFNGRFAKAGPISVAPLLGGQYNGVVSVLGNSASHMRILDFVERYGGPCLLHDVRLTHIYFQRLGQQKFRDFAAKLLLRAVTEDEVESWLKNDRPPSLFLERVLERASPLIVQTRVQQAIIKQRYGFDSYVATSCPALLFERGELAHSSRRSTRERLGIASSAFIASSFGCTARSKSIDTCIVALDLLRSWKIPVELYLVGMAGSAAAEVEQIAIRYGIHEYVHCVDTAQGAVTERDYLIASDAGLQLRNYNFGAPAALLSNCISAGLPSVATADMANSSDAPAYIRTVPDHFSPLHVAEELALIWEARQERSAYEEARSGYLETHNFGYYAKRLAGILANG